MAFLNKSSCPNPSTSCAGVPDTIVGEVVLPCALRQQMARDMAQAEAMPEGPMKDKRLVTLNKVRKNTGEVWEQKCGLRSGGKRKGHKSRKGRKSRKDRKGSKSRRH